MKIKNDLNIDIPEILALNSFIYEDNIYTGGFKDNMCDGYGTLISAGKNQIFMTKFIKGKMKSEIDEEKKISEFEIINK